MPFHTSVNASPLRRSKLWAKDEAVIILQNQGISLVFIPCLFQLLLIAFAGDGICNVHVLQRSSS